MKKLYTVTLSTDIVVYAESEAEAEKIARGNSVYDLGSTHDDLEPEVWTDFQIPHGWNEGCIPFGVDVEDQKTIGEILAETPPTGGEDKP